MGWKKSLGKMMGVAHFKAELLHNSSGVYSPGDVIRGNVVVVNSSQINFFGKNVTPATF